MRIAFVSDAVYPYNKGGKEKRLFELTTRLAILGHDVHIYTMHWWKTPEKLRIEHGVQLHAIAKYHNMYHGDRRSIIEGVLFGLACFKLLSIPFDVLDVDHMPFFPVYSAWAVCLLRGKKLYGTWHEALTTKEWVEYMGVAGYLASAIEYISIKLPFGITAASDHTKKLLGANHHRMKRVFVVASGVDSNLLRQVKPVNQAFDVLYAGRLVKDKHVDVLISAMDIMTKSEPNVRCIIIGHGIERDNLMHQIQRSRLSSNIQIVDPLPEALDVYAYMKQAKVFVLPSVREGFGIVALEALSCGTPVVTIDASANAAKDLIDENKTGSVVPLEATALADAIILWVKRHKKLATNERLATFDWDALALRQVTFYESAIRTNSVLLR